MGKEEPSLIMEMFDERQDILIRDRGHSPPGSDRPCGHGMRKERDGIGRKEAGRVRGNAGTEME